MKKSMKMTIAWKRGSLSLYLDETDSFRTIYDFSRIRSLICILAVWRIYVDSGEKNRLGTLNNSVFDFLDVSFPIIEEWAEIPTREKIYSSTSVIYAWSNYKYFSQRTNHIGKSINVGIWIRIYCNYYYQ